MISPSEHRRRGRVTVLAPYSLIAALVVAATLGPATASDYKCNRVLDGDTIHIVANNTEITLRLFAIDAPETSKTKHDPGQPFSQAASRHLAGLVLNRTVHFKNCGTDRYGRTLAVVFVDGKDVNIDLLKAGLAEVYRGSSGTGQQMALYREAEKEAREAGRGMWALKENYISPKEWRERRKNPAGPKQPPGRHYLSSTTY